MISLDWSLAVSAGIFLTTLFLLNRILFQPLLKVLDERKARTSDMFVAVGDEADRYHALLNEYDEKVREERQAGYRHAESVRNEATQQRQERIGAAREEATELIQEARSKIDSDLSAARRELKEEAEEIASLISSRVLKGT